MEDLKTPFVRSSTWRRLKPLETRDARNFLPSMMVSLIRCSAPSVLASVVILLLCMQFDNRKSRRLADTDSIGCYNPPMLTCSSSVSEVKEELKSLLESLGEPFSVYLETGAFELTEAYIEAKFGDSAWSGYDLRCCLALELLDLAIATDMGEAPESIILPDHLMAQAIEQVMRLGEPWVVEELAKSISSVAADRAAGLTEFRTHLFAVGENLALEAGKRPV